MIEQPTAPGDAYRLVQASIPVQGLWPDREGDVVAVDLRVEHVTVEELHELAVEEDLAVRRRSGGRDAVIANATGTGRPA